MRRTVLVLWTVFMAWMAAIE